MTKWNFTRCGKCAAVVMAVLIVVCGCGGNGDYDSPILNEDVPVADIADLPDVEQTKAQMYDLIERVRAEVSRLVPASEPWQWVYDESRSSCVQQETGEKGIRLYTRHLVSNFSFSDAEWDAVFPAVQRLAAAAGLTGFGAYANSGRNHDVRFSSQDGRILTFGSREASLIAGDIACRRSAPAMSSVPGTQGGTP